MKIKAMLRRWIRNILNSDEVYPTDSPALPSQGSSPFNKEFDGWNFRIHRAVGGHIVEAWFYDPNPNVVSNSYAKSVSSSGRPEHKLFIVTDDEELGVELPNILTTLALERP